MGAKKKQGLFVWGSLVFSFSFFFTWHYYWKCIYLKPTPICHLAVIDGACKCVTCQYPIPWVSQILAETVVKVVTNCERCDAVTLPQVRGATAPPYFSDGTCFAAFSPRRTQRTKPYHVLFWGTLRWCDRVAAKTVTKLYCQYELLTLMIYESITTSLPLMCRTNFQAILTDWCHS